MHPSDPDSPFDFSRGLGIAVFLPHDYPATPCRVEVDTDEIEPKARRQRVCPGCCCVWMSEVCLVCVCVCS